MAFKINVGLSRKIGQPNFGSLGASCHIDLEIDPQTIGHGPEAIQRQIMGAFAICKQAVDTELAKCESQEAVTAADCFHPVEQPAVVRRYAQQPHNGQSAAPEGSSPRRPATAAQIKALHSIAGRAGLRLASELEQHCGVNNPSQLSIQQASRMIDHLKQSLTPTPA
jgi:hypothetical protein